MSLWSIFAQLQVPTITGRNPITGLTGFFHDSMTQAGSDLIAPLIIIGAIAGMFKGWLGMMAGALLGCVVAVVIVNADVIRNWAHSIVLG